jgi:alkylation response protein AidB-like acyl-CoA dehydrogenase
MSTGLNMNTGADKTMSEHALHMPWPDAGQDSWWRSADEFAHRQLAQLPAPFAEPGMPDRFTWQHGLDLMHGLGWASLCADEAWGGAGQGIDKLAAVLEAVSAVSTDAAAAVYASGAACLALRACQPRGEAQALLRDVAHDWLAWPAFHDVDEQLWPTVDAQGYLRGQVDMLLMGAHARWAVLPAQGRDQGLVMVLVDLAHPAVIRGAPLHTVGLRQCGITDVEFGGVPCEVFSQQGRALMMQMSASLVPAVLAMQCGLARASLHDATRHAMTRQQGGGPLIGWGEVKRLLSTMGERLHAMQGALAASLLNADQGQRARAPYAALHVGALACELTEDGVQVSGGAGYVASHPQARRLCDARQLKTLLGGVAWRRQAVLLRQPGYRTA